MSYPIWHQRRRFDLLVLPQSPSRFDLLVLPQSPSVLSTERARESHTELANVVEGVERQGSLVSRGVVLLDAQSPSGSTGAVLIISGSTGAVLIVLVGRTKHAPAERVAITGPAQQPHHRRRR